MPPARPVDTYVRRYARKPRQTAPLPPLPSTATPSMGKGEKSASAGGSGLAANVRLHRASRWHPRVAACRRFSRRPLAQGSPGRFANRGGRISRRLRRKPGTRPVSGSAHLHREHPRRILRGPRHGVLLRAVATAEGTHLGGSARPLLFRSAGRIRRGGLSSGF